MCWKALGSILFSFLLSTGAVFCLFLVAGLPAALAGYARSADIIFNVLLFAAPIMGISAALWRYISENKKINKTRKTLEQIKHLYLLDLSRQE